MELIWLAKTPRKSPPDGFGGLVKSTRQKYGATRPLAPRRLGPALAVIFEDTFGKEERKSPDEPGD
jgi:hypothetical protein